MIHSNKLALLLSLTILLNFSPLFSANTQAQLLPRTTKTSFECEKNFLKSGFLQEQKKILESGKTDNLNDLLGCAIKTGNVKLWMMPFFITYLINFGLAIAGLVSTLFIVIGGYNYIVGSAQGQTDNGKNTIFYAIIGLTVTLLAWIIVNIVQALVT